MIHVTLVRTSRPQIGRDFWLNDNLPVVKKYPPFRTKNIQPLVCHIRFYNNFCDWGFVNFRLEHFFYKELIRFQTLKFKGSLKFLRLG